MYKFFKKFIAFNTLIAIAFMLMLQVMPLSISHADSEGGTSGGSEGGVSNTLQNPLKVDSIPALIKNVMDIFTYLAIIVAVIMFIVVGLQFILARGNPEELKKAKNRFFMIVIGVAIILGAKVIIDIIINTISATGVVDESIIQNAKNTIN